MAQRHEGSDRERIATNLARSGVSAIEGQSRPLAYLLEFNPLLRLLAHEAVADLGFDVAHLPPAQASSPEAAVLFVGLDSLEHCPRCCAIKRVATAGVGRVQGRESLPFTIGYISGPVVMLAAHRLHECADLLVHLRAQGGRATFVYPDVALRGQAGDHEEVLTVLPPDLTPREADILLLLLAGCSTSTIAARLWLSASTVRSHCRSVLRKCGVRDRKALRRQVLGPGGGALLGTPVIEQTPLPRPAHGSDRLCERIDA